MDSWVVSVELLNDTRSILDDLLVTVLSGNSERLDNTSDTHIFKGSSALFVDTKVTN